STLHCAQNLERTSVTCRGHNDPHHCILDQLDLYMFKLKEDDDACWQAYNSGTFFLFYNFSPFVQRKGKALVAPKLKTAEIKRLLQKFQKSEKMIEESVLVGCSEECTPYFALDLVTESRGLVF
uniref:Nudix hydrolase 13 n=1 Tax=Laticauda laticaudata TaxID=8630 RepID=A0A8C5SVI1_LATLA